MLSGCSDSVACHLEEGLLLLQVFTDHGGYMVRFTVGSQFVSSSTPVLFSFVLLLQALKHTADLWEQTHLVYSICKNSLKKDTKIGQIKY